MIMEEDRMKKYSRRLSMFLIALFTVFIFTTCTSSPGETETVNDAGPDSQDPAAGSITTVHSAVDFDH